MNVIILAAGVGKRLNQNFENLPKSLIPIGGKTLLARHFDILSQLGCQNATIVIGYEQDKIIKQFGASYKQININYVKNPRYTEGSIYSLYLARDYFHSPFTIIMDGDVLYSKEMMRRLVESKSPDSFLMDESQNETGEEMMLGAKNGRVIAIDRTIGQDFDQYGEGVGFLKITAEAGKILGKHLEHFIKKDITNVEYEDAVNAFLQEYEVGYELIGGLPWTEIDFLEDIQKAETEILPALEQHN